MFIVRNIGWGNLIAWPLAIAIPPIMLVLVVDLFIWPIGIAIVAIIKAIQANRRNAFYARHEVTGIQGGNRDEPPRKKAHVEQRRETVCPYYDKIGQVCAFWNDRGRRAFQSDKPVSDEQKEYLCLKNYEGCWTYGKVARGSA